MCQSFLERESDILEALFLSDIVSLKEIHSIVSFSSFGGHANIMEFSFST